VFGLPACITHQGLLNHHIHNGLGNVLSQSVSSWHAAFSAQSASCTGTPWSLIQASPSNLMRC
jgi:hypothetical protein